MSDHPLGSRPDNEAFHRPAQSGDGGEPTERPRVTVSIPCFRCKPYVRKAVESILEQTYTHLRVVVVNDGDPDPPWSVLADLDDPRLIRLDLPKNYGSFFANAVVLEATPDPYHLVQDADDWSEPDRVAVLLRKLRREHADAAVSSKRLWKILRGRATRGKIKRYPGVAQPLSEEYLLRVAHHGLFRVDALRDIGGYYGGFRVGYDAFLMNVLMMTGRISYVEEPLYNCLIRPDSLSRSRETGGRSSIRLNARKQMGQLYREAYGYYNEYLDGSIDEKSFAGLIREICRSRLTEQEKQEIRLQSQRFREEFRSMP